MKILFEIIIWSCILFKLSNTIFKVTYFLFSLLRYSAPKSDVVLKSEVEEIIEKRFIESFILLLKSTYDDGKVESVSKNIKVDFISIKKFVNKICYFIKLIFLHYYGYL